MTAPVWVHELAATFWRAANIPLLPASSGSSSAPTREPWPFPRDLHHAIVRALPLTPISLPRLRIAEIDAWLSKQGIPCAIRGPDRALRACLVAHTGHGALFIDSEDLEDEQRFSLAHELAHFLRDYWGPRRLAAEKFGQGVLDIFDGRRPPRPDERIHSLLAIVPVGFQIHLMERSTHGRIEDPKIAAAERDADLLAFELLAPEEAVLHDLDGVLSSDRRAAASDLLQQRYGLPTASAAHYSAHLTPDTAQMNSFTRRLWPVQ